MDVFANIMSILPYLLQAVQVAQNINADTKAGSGLNTFDVIQKEAPAVVDVFTKIGQTLFPNVPASQQPAAAAVALDPATVTKIQTALNSRMVAGSAQLVVDGIYGAKTKAAVLAFQQANNLTADEWAGPLTQKALGVTA